MWCWETRDLQDVVEGCKPGQRQAMGSTRGLLALHPGRLYPLVKSDGAPSVQLHVSGLLWTTQSLLHPQTSLFLQNKPLGSPCLPCLADALMMRQPRASDPRGVCMEQDLEVSSLWP